METENVIVEVPLPERLYDRLEAYLGENKDKKGLFVKNLLEVFFTEIDVEKA